LRNEIKEGTDIGRKVEAILGSGGLVEDGLVNEIVEKNMAKVRGEGKIVLLDGYPRTKSQAVALDEIESGGLRDKILVIELDVDQEEVVARISQRRVCGRCGNTYGPDVSVCFCGGELIKRKDDNETTVRNRLREYKEATLPLSQYYSDRIVKVLGKGTPEEVAQRVDDCLRNLGIAERR
jgi:adenylate kinase